MSTSEAGESEACYSGFLCLLFLEETRDGFVWFGLDGAARETPQLWIRLGAHRGEARLRGCGLLVLPPWLWCRAGVGEGSKQLVRMFRRGGKNVKGSSSTSEIGAAAQCGQEALEDSMIPSIYGQSSGRTRANYKAPRTENTSPPIQSSSVVCVGVLLISATPARLFFSLLFRLRLCSLLPPSGEKRTAYPLVAVGSARRRRLRLMVVGSASWPSLPSRGCWLRFVAVGSTSSPSAPPRHLRHVAVGSAIADMFNKSRVVSALKSCR
ncbi:hypothetical protein NL676_039546 [Syzygium grande]|nr:hypothetical protein NL676_039546 [Syzygium grande]